MATRDLITRLSSNNILKLSPSPPKKLKNSSISSKNQVKDLPSLNNSQIVIQFKSTSSKNNKPEDKTLTKELTYSRNNTSSKKINSVDCRIEENTLIPLFKGKPFYLEFLFDNNNKTSFIESKQKELTFQPWSELKEKDKYHYLYSKIQYYTNLTKSKEAQNDKYERLIQDKNDEVKRLQELLHENEKESNASGDFRIESYKKKDIGTLEKELNEYPKIIQTLDQKIKNSEQIIQNYENPTGGLPIKDIISQLDEEKQRLKSEVDKQNEQISELDQTIEELNGSIQILDFKSNLPKQFKLNK